MPRKTGGKKAAKKKSSHPTYEEMIRHAILDMGDRGGSSLQAIKKYILDNYRVPEDGFAPRVNNALRNQVDEGNLEKNKGSYRLASNYKAKYQKEAKEVSKEKKYRDDYSSKSSKSSSSKRSKSKSPSPRGRSQSPKPRMTKNSKRAAEDAAEIQKQVKKASKASAAKSKSPTREKSPAKKIAN